MRLPIPAARYLALLALLWLAAACGSPPELPQVAIPYKGIDWQNVHYLHSGSHLHARSPDVWEEIYEMGIRHFALTNYYPSKPTYPLPERFLEGSGDIVASPSAEQHSTTDHSLHFTSLGSFYTTGYGRGFSTEFGVEWNRSPFEYTFRDLHIYDPESRAPGNGVYRVDLRLEAATGAGGPVEVSLTLEGAERCDPDTFEKIGDGRIRDEVFRGEGENTIYFRVIRPEVYMRVEFDPDRVSIDRTRVMQGTNRPWRQAFTEALDGDFANENGKPAAGLLYPEGGGIVINHPRHPVEDSNTMLDFDRRVLGVEVWNHRRWFGLEDNAPHMKYYDHWDAILRTRRRAYGFFVKDHRWSGRGRNILLVPEPEGRSARQQERDALKAYRNGAFFGSLGAWDTVDEENRVEQPFDRSRFYLTGIEVLRTDTGRPRALRVAVDGNDERKRPHIQIRFVTGRGIGRIVNGEKSAVYELPVEAGGKIGIKYVRVEAFAFPDTHNGGELLTPELMADKNVYEIARIHDRLGHAGGNDMDPEGREPVGTVDMIFSQPVRFLHEPG